MSDQRKRRRRRRKSKTDLLPESIRKNADAMIRSDCMTQDAMREKVNQAIVDSGMDESEQVSRSAFNRYIRKVHTQGEKILQAREVAEVWVSKLGEAPTTDVGKLLQEFIRSLAFDTTLSLMNQATDENPVSVRVLSELALLSQRIEQASSVRHKVEAELQEQFVQKAAAQVDQMAREAGVSDATAAELKKKFMGIKV